MSRDQLQTQRDADLMVRVAEGDEAAVANLYDLHGLLVRDFFLKQSAKSNLGLDVARCVERTFVLAYQRAWSYDGKRTVEQWIALRAAEALNEVTPISRNMYALVKQVAENGRT